MKRVLSFISLACILLASCKVDLKIYVNNIAFATSAKSIVRDESAILKVDIYPEDATDKTLRWSTSDDSIVTVSQNGEIKGIAPGKAVITVVANDGGFKDNCFVTVKDKDIHVTGLVWTSTDKTTDAITISKSDNVTLGVSVLPSDATNKNVSWTSSDEKVIKVDSAGKLTPVADGQASVIVTTEEGGFTAVCNVTVSENASGITLSETTLNLKEFEQKRLVATITPEDATDKSVVWSSSDEKIAVVAYGTVTAREAGTCEITATHGAYSAKCSVTVTCPVHEVDLNEHSATLKLGGSFQLVATVHPERASNKTLEWSSANSTIASVSDDGLVKAMGLGETEIIAASADNPSVLAKCKVKVIATEISVSPDNLDIYENGEPVQLKVTGADPQDVTWTSRDKQIATVDANGTVHGLKAGTTEIYVVCKDSGSMAFCRVNVHTHVKNIDVYYNGKLVETNETVNVYVKEDVAFEVVLQPKETVLDKTVTWESDNKDVIAWWEEEQKFFAKKAGDAKVTVTAADGGITASVKVHVGDHVESVSINPESVIEDFYVGDTKEISAVVVPSSALDKSVTWKSENTDIVSVEDLKNGTAKLTAKKQGSVTIIAKSVDGGKEGECKVTVSSKVDGVTIYDGTTNITGKTCPPVRVGTNKTLRAEVTPDTVLDKSVVWDSSNKDIATVNSGGVVTFKNGGTVDISATSVLGGASAKTTFDVRPDIQTITLDKTEASIVKNSTLKLTATPAPANAYNTMMRWASDNEDVATVSQNGVVTAHKSGKAVITATSTAVPSVSASCAVTVTTPVESVRISSNVASIAVGEDMALTATVLPEDADNREVKWTSGNNDIVTVSDDGVIHGVATGEAVVTVSSQSDSNIKAECAVTVIKEKKPVTSVTFNETSHKMNVNTTFQIVATVIPEDATSKTLNWTSSNEDVATVDQEGLVTAKAEGSTNIVAMATDGSKKSATCSITVVDPSNIKITSLSFSPVESPYLEKGNTLSITPIILPEDASNKTLKWHSSDENVATVAGGVVTPVSKGNVSISAETTDGSELSAKLDLIVVDSYVPVKGVKIYANGVQVSGSFDLYVGEKQLFEAVVNPSDATNQNVRWEKNVGGRGLVYPNGKSCEVTAGELNDEEESAALNLSVLSQENAEYKTTIRVIVIRRPLEGISFAQPEVNVQKGKNTQLAVTFNPYNATDKTLVWSYKDEPAGKEILTLDAKTGSVTGVKTGSCVIVATSKRYGFSAECTVTVVNGSDTEHIGFEDWN